MAELAANVGHQLIHVDYDNNKHDYNNDNSVHPSSVRRMHHEPGGGGLGCLVDLNPNDFQQQVRFSEAPVTSSGDDSTLTATGCDATSNIPCARCGLQLHHHHHHHQRPQHQHQQPASLLYGQFCTDGSFSDDRYPVGLRTPE